MMKRSRFGITLMEVVAVIAIIAVLFCMIIPAIGEGRRASRRTQCANNYKQLLLGLQNYEFQNLSLPPGVVNPTGPIHNRPEGFHMGWMVALLPFIEQSGVAAAIDPTVSVYEQGSTPGFPARINIFRCPSDPFVSGPTSPWPSSYAGCHHDVEAPIDVDNHGVFFLNSRVRREDIVDGTSFTVFIGEKPNNANDLGWLSGTRATLRNTGRPLNHPHTFRDDLTDVPGAADALAVGGFASYHGGGANFGFGDGSVRFIRQSIDMNVYRRLGHREDGELISASDLGSDLGRPQPDTR